MPASQPPSRDDIKDLPRADGQPPVTPDQDGPHDVPDDEVIEKTLPATKHSDQPR